MPRLEYTGELTLSYLINVIEKEFEKYIKKRGDQANSTDSDDYFEWLKLLHKMVEQQGLGDQNVTPKLNDPIILRGDITAPTIHGDEPGTLNGTFTVIRDAYLTGLIDAKTAGTKLLALTPDRTEEDRVATVEFVINELQRFARLSIVGTFENYQDLVDRVFPGGDADSNPNHMDPHEGIIYIVKGDTKMGRPANSRDEYFWQPATSQDDPYYSNGGHFELFGTTDIDLSSYIRFQDVKEITPEQVDILWNAAFGSTNAATYAIRVYITTTGVDITGTNIVDGTLVAKGRNIVFTATPASEYKGPVTVAVTQKTTGTQIPFTVSGSIYTVNEDDFKNISGDDIQITASAVPSAP